MKNYFYYFVYLLMFIIGYRLLHYAHIFDYEDSPGIERFSKFLIMIIVLIATTRWGVKLYAWLTGYKK